MKQCDEMGPTYDLEDIRKLILQEKFFVTLTAVEGAASLGLDDGDIRDCVTKQMNETHFYKTMPAERAPGLWQDVYKIRYAGHRLYIKVQVNAAGRAVIVSFKQDTSE